jgi:Tfp pilus assembly protein PilN
MTIKLDLRPAALRRETRKAVHVTRLVATILLVAFCIVSAVCILYGSVLAFRLREEKASLKLSIEELTAQDVRLTGELKRLQNESARFTENLALVKAELPALEFLNAVQGALPAASRMDSVEVNAGTAKLVGIAASEGEVVAFARKLGEAPLVTSVSFPVTSKQGNLIRFELTCSLLDMDAYGQKLFKGGDSREPVNQP